MPKSEKSYLVVVGVDYSEASNLALDQAFELAGARPNAELHVVNVVRLYNQASIEAPIAAEFSPVSLAEAKAQLDAHVERRRQAYAASNAPADGPRLPRVISELRLEAPAEEIAQLAAELDADLVVVGTHGRRGISRLPLGSVAEAVVRLSPCPVFVVRPKALPAEGPKIEPPCPRCVEARTASLGAEYWCEQHRARHGQRHTYHQRDRVGSETEMPLVYQP